MIAMGLFLAAIGLVLVRIGWERRRAIAFAGWTAVTAAIALLARADGAWGIAMGGVVAMATALLLVLTAGCTSPARTRRAPREAPSVSIPRRRHDLIRRVVVFILVVPVGFVAAQWLAFGAQAAARHAGLGESDATVLTLFLQPVLWLTIMAVQMTRADARRMIAAPAVATVAGTMLWAAA